jgi:hypothetical protein
MNINLAFLSTEVTSSKLTNFILLKMRTFAVGMNQNYHQSYHPADAAGSGYWRAEMIPTDSAEQTEQTFLNPSHLHPCWMMKALGRVCAHGVIGAQFVVSR